MPPSQAPPSSCCSKDTCCSNGTPTNTHTHTHSRQWDSTNLPLLLNSHRPFCGTWDSFFLHRIFAWRVAFHCFFFQFHVPSRISRRKSRDVMGPTCWKKQKGKVCWRNKGIEETRILRIPLTSSQVLDSFSHLLSFFSPLHLSFSSHSPLSFLWALSHFVHDSKSRFLLFSSQSVLALLLLQIVQISSSTPFLCFLSSFLGVFSPISFSLSLLAQFLAWVFHFSLRILLLSPSLWLFSLLFFCPALSFYPLFLSSQNPFVLIG